MKMKHSTHVMRGRRSSLGLSIVEMMIGVTISLFILAGATMLLTSQLGDNRRLLLEAQLQQDLRTAADMISRDIRRAGYWGQAYRSVCPPSPATCTAAANPYRDLATESTTQVIYARSTDEEVNQNLGTDDGLVDGQANRPREQVGFRWNASNKTIDFLVGANNWQALTDAAVMQVTQFSMTLAAVPVPVPCGTGPCSPTEPTQALGPGGCRLVQMSRDVSFSIVAQAMHDSNVKRSVSDNVRLRNHVPAEVCPP